MEYGVVKLIPEDERRLEAQAIELVRTGQMPTFDKVLAAIETTRQTFRPLIPAAQREISEELPT